MPEINCARIISVLNGEYLVFENIISQAMDREEKQAGDGDAGMPLRGPIERVVSRLSTPSLTLLRPFEHHPTQPTVLAFSLDLTCKHLPGYVVVTARTTALH